MSLSSGKNGCLNCPNAASKFPEVVSPTDVYQDVHLKAMRYSSLGTALVWVVYPARKMINVYRPAEEGANVQTVALDGVLSGGDILPGLQLAAKDVFSVLG